MILGLTVQVASDIVNACGIKNKNQDNLDHMKVFTVSIEITCIKLKLRSETPSLRIFLSLVQQVLNLGTRMAAAISSGSASIPPKRFSRAERSAAIKGSQNLEATCRCWSLVHSRIMVGSNHPIYTLMS